MRITDVTPLPFTTPEGRCYLAVRITTDAGLSGLGEFGASFQEAAGIGALNHAAALLVGRDPFDSAALWQELWRRDFHPGGLVAAAAISAIDLALWDLKGKALGQPVWRLLGGKVRDRVEVYVHVGGGDQDSIIRRSLERIREGWRYLRFSVTEAPGGRFDARLEVDRTIELLRAVRQAVGPDIELILDAHTRLEPPDAVRLGRTLEPVRLAFLEDPLRSEYPEGYRGLRRQLGVPLAAGEQYATKWAFRSLVEEDLVDFLRLDLCNVGGLTEAAKIAGWAELHQQRIVPHNPLSPISSAACLHFAIATENVCLVEAGRTDDAFLRDLFPTRPAFPPAAWPAPDAPGLGVELDDAALASHPFRDGSCPRFHRPDGSFTNW